MFCGSNLEADDFGNLTGNINQRYQKGTQSVNRGIYIVNKIKIIICMKNDEHINKSGTSKELQSHTETLISHMHPYLVKWHCQWTGTYTALH